MVVHRVGFPVAGVIPLVDMVRCPTAAGAADWWDPDGEGLCVWAAYQPKGAADFATSMVDLSGNGNNAGNPGGPFQPGWDAVNGWTFGALDYLTTTFVPQIDQSQTVIAQFTTVTNDGFLCGINEPGVGFFALRPNWTGARVYYYNGGNNFGLPALLAGNLAVAGNQGYRNGVVDGGAIGAWAGAPSYQLVIGAVRGAAGAGSFLDFYCQALAIYDCALTAPQVASVYAAMAAL